MSIKKGDVVVVRDHRSGVWLGTLVDFDFASKTCELAQARRAHYWEAGGDCSGLATVGPSGGSSRISDPVESVAMCDVVEIVSTTAKARDQWASMPGWVK